MSKKIAALIIFLAILLPFYISFGEIRNSSIPFWYDPARDLLMAWNNLVKPTLIGPPSGIPGIFYGPHWLWFLSFGLIFSKDPRIVTGIILTIPYFTVFPFLLFKFARLFGKQVAFVLWLLFIFAYRTYSTHIWSPHLAPLFFLGMIYLVIFTDFQKKTPLVYLRIAVAGILAGLIINVQISFGVAVIFSALIFFPAVRKPLLIFPFVLGLLISLSPNLIFELRHGGNQIKAILYTFSQSFLYHSTVVGYIGLTKQQIIQEFLNLLGRLLNTPVLATFIVYATIIAHTVFSPKTYFTRKDKLTKKLLIYLSVCTLSVLGVYLSSRNPVWVYHFIGSEIIILLFWGFVLSRFSLLRNIITVWVVYLVFVNIGQAAKSSDGDQYKISSLASKKYIVETIYNDARETPFSTFAYSTAIYTFDYDYIFRWLGQDKYNNIPRADPERSKYIYLIIPRIEEALKVDFINYKTPQDKYKTVSEWKIPDGTTVYKRETIIE